MKNRLHRSRWIPRVLTVAAIGCGLGFAIPMRTVAEELDKVLSAEEKRLQQAQASQERINGVAKETRDLESEYRRLLEEMSGLELYNDYMERQIGNQALELAELRAAIDDVSTVERQIMPLMIRMLDALEKFVELDMAFLQEERTARVANLKVLMERADLSVSEKFRSLTETFQIESDFGRTIESYKETLVIEGSTLEVSLLRLGRIGLYYQTSDASQTGRWDQSTREWVAMSGGKARNQVRQGLRIARQQIAPDLLLLRIEAPEVTQ